MCDNSSLNHTECNFLKFLFGFQFKFKKSHHPPRWIQKQIPYSVSFIKYSVCIKSATHTHTHTLTSKPQNTVCIIFSESAIAEILKLAVNYFQCLREAALSTKCLSCIWKLHLKYKIAYRGRFRWRVLFCPLT